MTDRGGSSSGVERGNKHAGTVLFLFKALVGMAILLFLIKYFAKVEAIPFQSCQMEESLGSYPEHIQRNAAQMANVWLMCPKDFNLRLGFDERYDNETDMNATIVDVFVCTSQDKNYDNGDHIAVSDGLNDWRDLPVHWSGICACVLDCTCLNSVLMNTECYVKAVGPQNMYHPGDHHDKDGVFGIYFVLMTLLMAVSILFYGIFKITMMCIGEKRTGHTVLV